MKFLRTLTTDITWLYYQGTIVDLQKAQQWIDKHRTQWVMVGRPTVPFEEDGKQESATLRHLATKRAERHGLPDPVEWCLGWGFKNPSDALRFKLSIR
jgi:hypothetical protein